MISRLSFRARSATWRAGIYSIVGLSIGVTAERIAVIRPGIAQPV
jgi:hypothetical protein